jgi:hypothetical protein
MPGGSYECSSNLGGVSGKKMMTSFLTVRKGI